MAYDVYQTLTDKIVRMIEQGAGEWRMPWHGAGLRMPRNPFSGTKYRGLNVPLLWCASEAAGYDSHTWATYKQWSAAGAQVRKGERSSLVFFWKKLVDADDEKEAEAGWISTREPRFIARTYNVFAAEQVDGFELQPATTSHQGLDDSARIAAAEQFFAALPATVQHGGNRAFYSPAHDLIQLPEFARFHTAADYYSTRGHESVHWTKQPKRCNREFSKRFGDQAYAFEELVAELGAAFLCADLGISNEPRPDHAAYIANWLQVLKNDKRAIFTAGSKAQAAVDYLAAQAAAAGDQRKAA